MGPKNNHRNDPGRKKAIEILMPTVKKIILLIKKWLKLLQTGVFYSVLLLFVCLFRSFFSVNFRPCFWLGRVCVRSGHHHHHRGFLASCFGEHTQERPTDLHR